MRSILKNLALVAGCAAVSLAASQCAAPRERAQHSDATPLAGPPVWSAQSTPAQIAAWALRSCRGSARRNDCIEKVLEGAIAPAGVDKSMAALALLVAQDQEVASDSHVFAHGIGIAAYTVPETVGATFLRCNADFQSGCYHGVIQAYFADTRGGGESGVTPERLNGLCAPYRSAEKRWLDFQCAHGIGHGLMAVQAHHLLHALDSCDLINDHFEQQACWGGAFMENVVNATQPHHSAVTQMAESGAAGHQGRAAAEGEERHRAQEASAGHQEHAAPAPAPAGNTAMAGHAMPGGSMAGHDMSAMGHDMSAMGHAAPGGAEPFKALDPEQPLYPCTVVKEQHRQSCYLMQTSAILYRNHGDFRDAARQCARAPEAYRNTCYISLGRDANSWGRGNPAQAIAYCGAAPEAGEPFCIVGVVKNRVDVTADSRDGLSFCRSVPDNAKPACYHAVGQEIALLSPTHPGREAACRVADPGYIPECRRGAGLPLVPTD